MRKILSAAAAAGLTLSIGAVAYGADAPRPVYKAPPVPAPMHGWTGCYAGGGAGYGRYDEETALVTVRSLPGIPAGTTFVDGITQGARGWLATAQVGCDYQLGGAFADRWIVGAFADGEWSNMKGRHTGGNPNIGLQQGEEALRREWALGGRLGWLVSPRLLTFASAGYTTARFDDVNYVSALFPAIGAPVGLQVPARSYRGWFVGGGTEYAIGWLPGLFWKNEYRFADYGDSTDTVICTAAALCGVVGPTAFAERNHPRVQTVRTELVWRFNWGSGGLAALD